MSATCSLDVLDLYYEQLCSSILDYEDGIFESFEDFVEDIIKITKEFKDEYPLSAADFENIFNKILSDTQDAKERENLEIQKFEILKICFPQASGENVSSNESESSNKENQLQNPNYKEEAVELKLRFLTPYFKQATGSRSRFLAYVALNLKEACLINLDSNTFVSNNKQLNTAILKYIIKTLRDYLEKISKYGSVVQKTQAEKDLKLLNYNPEHSATFEHAVAIIKNIQRMEDPFINEKTSSNFINSIMIYGLQGCSNSKSIEMFFDYLQLKYFDSLLGLTFNDGVSCGEAYFDIPVFADDKYSLMKSGKHEQSWSDDDTEHNAAEFVGDIVKLFVTTTPKKDANGNIKPLQYLTISDFHLVKSVLLEIRLLDNVKDTIINVNLEDLKNLFGGVFGQTTGALNADSSKLQYLLDKYVIGKTYAQLLNSIEENPRDLYPLVYYIVLLSNGLNIDPQVKGLIRSCYDAFFNPNNPKSLFSISLNSELHTENRDYFNYINLSLLAINPNVSLEIDISSTTSPSLTDFVKKNADKNASYLSINIQSLLSKLAPDMFDVIESNLELGKELKSVKFNLGTIDLVLYVLECVGPQTKTSGDWTFKILTKKKNDTTFKALNIGHAGEQDVELLNIKDFNTLTQLLFDKVLPLNIRNIDSNFTKALLSTYGKTTKEIADVTKDLIQLCGEGLYIRELNKYFDSIDLKPYQIEGIISNKGYSVQGQEGTSKVNAKENYFNIDATTGLSKNPPRMAIDDTREIETVTPNSFIKFVVKLNTAKTIAEGISKPSTLKGSDNKSIASDNLPYLTGRLTEQMEYDSRFDGYACSDFTFNDAYSGTDWLRLVKTKDGTKAAKELNFKEVYTGNFVIDYYSMYLDTDAKGKEIAEKDRYLRILSTVISDKGKLPRSKISTIRKVVIDPSKPGETKLLKDLTNDELRTLITRELGGYYKKSYDYISLDYKLLNILYRHYYDPSYSGNLFDINSNFELFNSKYPSKKDKNRVIHDLIYLAQNTDFSKLKLSQEEAEYLLGEGTTILKATQYVINQTPKIEFTENLYGSFNKLNNRWEANPLLIDNLVRFGILKPSDLSNFYEVANGQYVTRVWTNQEQFWQQGRDRLITDLLQNDVSIKLQRDSKGAIKGVWKIAHDRNKEWLKGGKIAYMSIKLKNGEEGNDYNFKISSLKDLTDWAYYLKALEIAKEDPTIDANKVNIKSAKFDLQYLFTVINEKVSPVETEKYKENQIRYLLKKYAEENLLDLVKKDYPKVEDVLDALKIRSKEYWAKQIKDESVKTRYLELANSLGQNILTDDALVDFIVDYKFEYKQNSNLEDLQLELARRIAEENLASDKNIQTYINDNLTINPARKYTYSINPEIERHNLYDYWLSLEFVNASVGSHMNHPFKALDKIKEGEYAGKKYYGSIAEIEAQMFGQQTKRNVSQTATIHPYLRNLVGGVSDDMNICIIRDLHNGVYGVNGVYSEATVADGATYVSGDTAIEERVSLANSETGILNKKLFGHDFNPFKGTGFILKTAGFNIVNEVIRNSIAYKNVNKIMLGSKSFLKEYNGQLLRIGVEFGNDSKDVQFWGLQNYPNVQSPDANSDERFVGYYFDPETLGHRALFFRKGDDASEDAFVSYICTREGTSITNNSLKKVTMCSELNTPLDIYNVLGAEWSEHLEDGELTYENDETSFINLYYIKTLSGWKNADIQSPVINSALDVIQPIKKATINYVATEGAVKQGASNVNTVGGSTNPELDFYGEDFDPRAAKITTMILNIANLGIQLDAEHHSDKSTLSLMTQVVNALGARGYSVEQCSEVYNALYQLTSIQLADVFESLELQDSEALRNVITKRILHSLSNVSSTDGSLLSTTITELKSKIKGEITAEMLRQNLPLDDLSVVNLLVSKLASSFEKDGIRIKFDGGMCVLTPSDGFIRMYDGKLRSEYKGQMRAILEEKQENVPFIDAHQIKLGKTYNITYTDGRTETVLIDDPVTYWKIANLKRANQEIKILENLLAGSDLSCKQDYFSALTKSDQPLQNFNIWDLDTIKIRFLVENSDLITKGLFGSSDLSVYEPLGYNGEVEAATAKMDKDKAAKVKSIYANVFTLRKLVEWVGYLALMDAPISLHKTSTNPKNRESIITADNLPTLEDIIENVESGYDLKYELEDNSQKELHDYFTVRALNELNAISENGRDIVVRINGVAYNVDKSTIKNEDYEVILPKFFKSEFGLKTGDHLSEIRDNKYFFLRRALLKFKLNSAEEDYYDLNLKSFNGDNFHIKYEEPDTLVEFAKHNLKEVEIKTFRSNGKLYRIDSKGNILYEIPQNAQIRVFKDRKGEEIVVTKNIAFFLDSLEYNFIKVSTALGEDFYPLEILDAINEELKKSDNRAVRALKRALEKHADENASDLKTEEEAQKEGKDESEEDDNESEDFLLRNSGFIRESLDREVESLLEDIEKGTVVESNYKGLLKHFIQEGKLTHTAFLESLKVIASRTPAQSLQSFMAMTCVGFDNSDMNPAYVSRWQLWLQGSDFDIDKVNILTPCIKRGKFLTWSPFMYYDNPTLLQISKKLPFPTGKKLNVEKSKNTTEESKNFNYVDGIKNIDLFTFIDKNVCKGSIDEKSSYYYVSDNTSARVGLRLLDKKVTKTKPNKYSINTLHFDQLTEYQKWILAKTVAHRLKVGDSLEVSDPEGLVTPVLEKVGFTYDEKSKRYIKKKTSFTEDFVNYITSNISTDLQFSSVINGKRQIYHLNTLQILNKLLSGKTPNETELGLIIPILSNVLNTISKLPYVPNIDDITDDLVKSILNTLYQVVNKHNLYVKTKHKNLSGVAKNFIATRMHDISADAINAIQAMISVDFPTLIIKDLGEKQELALMAKNFNTRSLSSKILLLGLTLAGKENVGIVASAMKAFECASQYINQTLNYGSSEEQQLLLAKKDVKVCGKVIRLLANSYCKNAINVTDTEIEEALNSVDNVQDAFIWLSAFLSLATDNAKDPTLSKINAGPKTISLYTAGIVLGIEPEVLVNTICSPTGQLLNSVMLGNIFTDLEAPNNIEGAIQYIETGPSMSKANPLTILMVLQAYNDLHPDNKIKGNDLAVNFKALLSRLKNTKKLNEAKTQEQRDKLVKESREEVKALISYLTGSNVEAIEEMKNRSTTSYEEFLRNTLERKCGKSYKDRNIKVNNLKKKIEVAEKERSPEVEKLKEDLKKAEEINASWENSVNGLYLLLNAIRNGVDIAESDNDTLKELDSKYKGKYADWLLAPKSSFLDYLNIILNNEKAPKEARDAALGLKDHLNSEGFDTTISDHPFYREWLADRQAPGKTKDNDVYYESLEVLSELDNYFINLQELDKEVLADIKSLSKANSEMGIIRDLVKLNQGLPNAWNDLLQWVLNFEGSLAKQVKNFKATQNEKWKAFLQGNPKGKIDFLKYVLDEEYRNSIIQLYDDVCKFVINPYRAVWNTKHYRGYLKTMAALYKANSDYFFSYRTSDLLYRQILTHCNSEFLTATESEQLKNNVKHFIFDRIGTAFLLSQNITLEIPATYGINKLDAKNTNNLILGSRVKDASDTSVIPIDLNSPLGRLSFKLWMDHYVIPQIIKLGKTSTNDSVRTFVSHLTRQKYSFNAMHDTSLNYSLNIDTNPKTVEGISEYLKCKIGLASLSEQFGDTGFSIRDLLFLYNIVAYHNTNSGGSLKSLFEEILATSKEGITHEYILFASSLSISQKQFIEGVDYTTQELLKHVASKYTSAQQLKGCNLPYAWVFDKLSGKYELVQLVKVEDNSKKSNTSNDGEGFDEGFDAGNDDVDYGDGNSGGDDVDPDVVDTDFNEETDDFEIIPNSLDVMLDSVNRVLALKHLKASKVKLVTSDIKGMPIEEIGKKPRVSLPNNKGRLIFSGNSTLDGVLVEYQSQTYNAELLIKLAKENGFTDIESIEDIIVLLQDINDSVTKAIALEDTLNNLEEIFNKCN